MKKTFLSIFFILSAICLYFIYNYYTYDFAYTGDMKDGAPIPSPNGEYSAQVYYENYGGAAGGVNLIVNIIDHMKKDKEQTVYFSDAKGLPILNWVEPNRLSIINRYGNSNRSTVIIIGKEIYDENGRSCGKYKIKKQFVCKDKNSK
ncbi:MAG: DUF5412 family protein [Solibacillus sp.]